MFFFILKSFTMFFLIGDGDESVARNLTNASDLVLSSINGIEFFFRPHPLAIL